MEFGYTVKTSKPFAAAVEAVQAKTAEKGFKVQHVHDVQKTLAEKGFQRDPFSIVEI